MGQQAFKSEEYRQAVTNLSPEALQLIKKQFAHLASRSSDHCDKVDKDTFLRFIPLPGMLGERMFTVCDRKHENAIDFEDFVTSIALLTHGTDEDRYKLIFQMYDVEGLGEITRSELEMMFNSIRRPQTHSSQTPPPETSSMDSLHHVDQLDQKEAHELSQKISQDIHEIDTKIEQAHGDAEIVPALLDQKYHKERLLARMGRGILAEYRKNGETLHDTVKKMADDALKSCNASSKGTLSFAQFKHWVDQNPVIMQSIFESEGIHELRHRLSSRPTMRAFNPKMAPPKGVMYGYLFKGHRRHRGMDRRFYLLQDHFLYEFKNEKAAMSEATPHRAIFLPGCHIFNELYPSRPVSPSPTTPPTEFERATSPPPLRLGRSASRSSSRPPSRTAREYDRTRSKSRERVSRAPSHDHHDVDHGDRVGRPPLVHTRSMPMAAPLEKPPTPDNTRGESPLPAAAVPVMRRISSSSSLKDMDKRADTKESGRRSSTRDSFDRVSLSDTATCESTEDFRGNRSHSPSPTQSPVPPQSPPPHASRPKACRANTAPHGPILPAPVEDWHVHQQPPIVAPQPLMAQQSSTSSTSTHGSGRFATLRYRNAVGALFGLGGHHKEQHHNAHEEAGSPHEEMRSLASTKSRFNTISVESINTLPTNGSCDMSRTTPLPEDLDSDSMHDVHEKWHLHEIEIVYANHGFLLYAEDNSSFERWVKALEDAAQDKHIEDYYEIDFERQLGTGYFADVYYCSAHGVDGHAETGEELACKIVYKSEMSDTQTEMIRTEIACLNLVRHPNVVSVYDIFDTPEKMYIVMELLQGGSVLSRLERDGYFKFAEGRDIVKQLCEGIRYLHDVGIVHRDIKPGNLVFTSEREDAVLKIVDFGLSTFTATTDPLGKPVGTLKYFAPELILHKPYNRAVDMWCVGIVTYMIMSAQFPFEARTQPELLDNIANARVNTCSENWRAVPELAKNFILRLLVVDPEKRMTAEEAVHHAWLLEAPPAKLASRKSSSNGLKECGKGSSNRRESKDGVAPKTKKQTRRQSTDGVSNA